ncbi:MAG: DUF4058 family protein [Planctomycetes bacterium]|nr:DUF4058 family protein [Planctomycetota bacterium]
MAIHPWSRVDDGVFHHFHIRWIGALSSILNEGLLPRPYYAIAEPILGEAEPDVIALQAKIPSARSEKESYSAPSLLRSDSPEGAVALAPSGVRLEEFLPDPYLRKARWIVIKDAWQGDAVVAVIELVSRGNKISRARAEQFLRKTVGLLDRGIHVVMLDLHDPTNLVPRGFHILIADDLGHEASQPPADRPLSAVTYQVLDGGAVRAHFVPLKVGDSMPEMPVFLTLHEFLRLPLEATYNEAYRSVPWKFREALEGAGA